ncbi:hypothetical protein [Wolbachia endosymbiont of Atemnus politus]|uniref:hypothetical protein n=1 Tax=Wolbachia endosymbiont of Atemnus politus TaxID=2682840 RepID=UPI00397BD313
MTRERIINSWIPVSRTGMTPSCFGFQCLGTGMTPSVWIYDERYYGGMTCFLVLAIDQNLL